MIYMLLGLVSAAIIATKVHPKGHSFIPWAAAGFVLPLIAMGFCSLVVSSFLVAAGMESSLVLDGFTFVAGAAAFLGVLFELHKRVEMLSVQGVREEDMVEECPACGSVRIDHALDSVVCHGCNSAFSV